MDEKLNFKKEIIMEHDGNKLILLDDCDIINGVNHDKVKEMFPNFISDISNVMNCYIIELESGKILYS